MLLYADDLVLMSEKIEGLRNKFFKWKASFDCKGLKVSLVKTKVVVNGTITKDGMSKSKVDPCWVCSLRAKANSFFLVHCGRWIQNKCAGMMGVTSRLSRNPSCRKYEGNVGVTVEQEEKLCDKVETIREFTYLDDNMLNAGRGYAAQTAKT